MKPHTQDVPVLSTESGGNCLYTPHWRSQLYTGANFAGLGRCAQRPNSTRTTGPFCHGPRLVILL